MPYALRLLFALLDLGPELEKLLGDKWPAYRDQLLALSARVGESDVSAELRDALEALVAQLLTETPQAADLVRRAVADLRRQAEDEAAARESAGMVRRRGRVRPLDGTVLLSDEEDNTGVLKVPVFYGTDRARGDDTPSGYFRGLRGALAFGIARVSVPTRGRELGELTSPRWWRLEFSEDPEKHVILTGVEALDRDVFTTTLKDSLAAADERDALIFIHGYNVSFENAARRAAQISVDLKFSGRTLMYSWASAADAKQYTVDEGTVEWSREHFEAFLKLALTEIGAREVHVIAHSMGNRALVNTLERIKSWQLPAGAATLGQVIFAAPDIDRDRFIQLAAAFKGCARRCTLYASSRDVALRASKFVHGYPRAGEAGEALLIVDGVDTIDATLVDTSLVGLHHSYFGSKRSILNDMFNLIKQQLAPDQRFDLQSVGEALKRYWSYRA
ncbi:alpha/beta hydrolase [Bradyrhizobium diazoefficiens]|nr:alpha/beta hydrolase [Bradyrhizobium diazoefficiens]MBR0774390.1 alpha/beta hydrolase [Bradyrhizobium diazoefficiens]